MDSKQPVSLIRCLRRMIGVAPTEASDRELLKRFAHSRDEAAFETLVERHGPLVRGVCLRILGNPHDADDAFQATFLILARKAGAVGWHNSIGPWLYKTAHRLACRSRATAARRRQHEEEASALHRPVSGDDMTLGEVRQILDEELASLPEKYRAPVVLCCLEGKTRDEAAEELGWSAGSLKGRLERGRELLRHRLVRRGLTLSASLFALTLSQNAASAVPASLALATAQASVLFAAGHTVDGFVSAQALSLVHAFLKEAFLIKLKLSALTVLLALGLSGAAAGLYSQQTRTELSEPADREAVVIAPDAFLPVAADEPGEPVQQDPPVEGTPLPKTESTEKSADKPALPPKPGRSRTSVSAGSVSSPNGAVVRTVVSRNGERQEDRKVAPTTPDKGNTEDPPQTDHSQQGRQIP